MDWRVSERKAVGAKTGKVVELRLNPDEVEAMQAGLEALNDNRRDGWEEDDFPVASSLAVDLAAAHAAVRRR